VELGNNLLKRLEADLVDVGHVESPSKSFGRNVILMFGPTKVGKPHAHEETGKETIDAKTENKPLSGETVQTNQARQG